MISDAGVTYLPGGNAAASGLAGSTTAGNLANNLTAASNPNNPMRTSSLEINSKLSNMADAQLSPLLNNQSWAAMMQTPLMSSFNGGDPNNFDMSNSKMMPNWASQSLNASNIVLDDAKKFRRQGRASDIGAEQYDGSAEMANLNGSANAQGMLSGMYADQNRRLPQQQQQFSAQQAFNPAPTATLSNANQAAALSAQQNWRSINGLLGSSSLQPQNGPAAQNNGLQSPDLSNLANLQAAMQGMASPQMQMASLLAAQQQIQQQMQLQQNLNMLNNMASMSPLGMMGMQGGMQNQQMLSPGEFLLAYFRKRQ